MQRISLLFGLLMILLPIKAQHKSDFAILEDSIIQIHKSMLSEPRMEIRYQKNEQLLYLIEEVLNKKNSFSYKFDSLKTISVLTSPNKKVRIFTWYLIDDRNNCEYFGFLQTYNEQSNRYMLYPLIDKSKRIQNPVSQKLRQIRPYRQNQQRPSHLTPLPDLRRPQEAGHGFSCRQESCMHS